MEFYTRPLNNDYTLKQFINNGVGRKPIGFSFKTEYEPVPKYIVNHCAYIIRAYEIHPAQPCMGSRTAIQTDCGAWADPKLYPTL
jgi:hypothetical protein